MSRFKKIILMFLLTIPLVISTGLSSWIIINVKENENPPSYNYETIINNAFNGQDKDYNSTELGPDPYYDNIINEEIIASEDFKFYYHNGVAWVEGLPTESGSYQVKIVPEHIDDIDKGVEVEFTINKSDQDVTATNLTVTYDGKPHQIDESTIIVNFGNEEGLTITGNTPRTDVGTTTVSIAISGNKNFNPYSSSVQIKVIEKTIKI